MTWVVSSLSIRGVKGVLDRAGDFKLAPKRGKPKSIAIFGRNGQGKSGYADAVEYLFSIDGGIEHLGKGGADSEQGGKHAIPHVLAEDKGISPEIAIEFFDLETHQKVSVIRPVVTGRNDTRPHEIDTIVSLAPAHRILRQHDLRRFVVDMTPGEKFAEFARWVGLEGAAKLLSHLTTTENTLRETDVDREISERVKSIQDHTSGTIKSYNLKAILKWCEEEVKKHTGQVVPVLMASDIENAVQALRSHRELLLLQSQTARIYAARNKLEKAASAFADDKGPLHILETILPNVIQAEQVRDIAQNEASQSVFKEVWESAQRVILAEKPEVCPVCLTPWSNTKVGSVDNVLVALNSSLGSLSKFRSAETAFSRQRQNLEDVIQRTEQSLTEITELAKTLNFTQVSDEAVRLKSTCIELRQASQKIHELNKRFAEFIGKCTRLATQVIPQVLSLQELESTPASLIPIDAAISHLQGLKDTISRLESLKQQQLAIRTVERQFRKIADAIRGQIKALTENAVNALRADVEEIYKQVHPGEAVPNVFVELDAERKTLVIRVNFHSTERKVPPGGYLSEAQINTLGLALFLSSVRLFNKDFPFVFLDDIVSSYDADNRARVVDVIAEYMNGFQIFLTTHDERFYTHLRQRLEGENWLFERITSYEFEKGPRRQSDNLRPSEIDELITEGDPRVAGNAVRQFMEEWLDTICEKYEVNTPHRRDAREYQRTLYDFWQPFLNRVQKLGSGFGPYVVASLPYQRLKGSTIINYYSHYQANPYEWPAMGDVTYIWENFKDFIAMYNCYSCGKPLRYDQSDAKLYCTCGHAILPPE